MDQKIEIATYHEADQDKEDTSVQLKSPPPSRQSTQAKIIKNLSEIDPETLRTNLEPIIKFFSSIFKVTNENENLCLLDQIEIHLNVNARGGIELVGTFQAGVDAGIKIRLSRK